MTPEPRSANGTLWTITGQIDPANPDPQDIHLSDIARSLATKARFAGQTDPSYGPYTVIWHSLFCERLAEKMGCSRQQRLDALMHDASEYLLGDVPTPVKRLVPDYRALEARWWGVIAARFGLSPVLGDRIHQIDRLAFEIEAAHLCPRRPAEDDKLLEWADVARDWFDCWHHLDEAGNAWAMGARLFEERARALMEGAETAPLH